jgi:hypothetical protein
MRCVMLAEDSMGFRDYVHRRGIRRTKAGRFIAACRSDAGLPDAVTWDELARHLRGKGVDKGTLDVARRVWFDYAHGLVTKVGSQPAVVGRQDGPGQPSFAEYLATRYRTSGPKGEVVAFLKGESRPRERLDTICDGSADGMPAEFGTDHRRAAKRLRREYDIAVRDDAAMRETRPGVAGQLAGVDYLAWLVEALGAVHEDVGAITDLDRREAGEAAAALGLNPWPEEAEDLGAGLFPWIAALLDPACGGRGPLASR